MQVTLKQPPVLLWLCFISLGIHHPPIAFEGYAPKKDNPIFLQQQQQKQTSGLVVS